MNRPVRKTLPHEVPPWIKTGSPYFLTICCAQRGQNQLCVPAIADTLLHTVRHYHAAGDWHCRLLLLMPDHLHAIASFPSDVAMDGFIRKFKIYTAKQAGIDWQRNFFDHRLRNSDEEQFKADYIRQNPVRAGLVVDARARPHIWETF